MRSRISALALSLVLIASFAACNKKEQSQNQPATSETPSAQGSQTAGTTPPAPQNQLAPAQQPAPAPPMAQVPAEAPAPAPPPPAPPPPLVIPAGTHLAVRMGSMINTKTASAGDTFTGSLARAVTVHGAVAIPAGAGVSGTVVESKSPGKFKGEGVLSVTLTGINVRGVSTAIHSSTYTQTVKGKGKRTAVMAGGGTGAGALIGGLAGGGKGALIGGLVGAGAGTAGAAFTGNKDVVIDAESVVTFRLGRALTVQRPEGSSAATAAPAPAQ